MERKSFLNNPCSGSLWWNPAISQPWAPESPEGLGLGPVFYSGPVHWGERQEAKVREERVTFRWKRRRQSRSAGKKHHNSQTHNKGHRCIHGSEAMGWRDVGVNLAQRLHTYYTRCSAWCVVSGQSFRIKKETSHRGPILWTKQALFKRQDLYHSRHQVWQRPTGGHCVHFRTVI